MSIQEFLQELCSLPEPGFHEGPWDNTTFTRSYFQATAEGFFDAHEEAEFLLTWVENGPFLDLGAGTGRLSLKLHKRIPGVALDLSFEALKKGEIPGVQADFRHIPLKTGFELILLSFGQICFLPREDLPNLLKNCRKLLSKDGVLVIDLPSTEFAQDLDSLNEWEDLEEKLFFVQRSFLPESGLLTQKQIIVEKGTGTVESFVHTNQIYSLYELLELFKDLRFQVAYGAEDLQGTPIKEGSPWMIFVLKKTWS
jgi:SAM-dependent methyltransferase